MTVLVGWVPKPEGEAALDRAIFEAKLRGEDLVVLNTTSGASYADASYATDEQVQQVQDKLAASGVTHDVRHAVHGKQPSAEVLEMAEEVGASLIVIGLRHRSSVGKFLMGSTAQEILLGSRCPVLSVPAPNQHRFFG